MKLDAVVALVLTLLIAAPATAVAWEPTKPIEFVVPAGTGGGADQMARLIAGISEKHKLSPRPLIVINKAGGAGAEGFLDVKGKKGDAHTIIITLSNLFTTPLHNNLPFNWRDYTPLARMALDEFILWVNADTQYKTAKEYLAAVRDKQCKERQNGQCLMGGTGSAQEDHPARAGSSRNQIQLRALQGRRRGVREPRRKARGFDGEQPDRMRKPLEGRQGTPARRLRHGAHRGR
jgi:putative tricarboxylic transport membrane protein